MRQQSPRNISRWLIPAIVGVIMAAVITFIVLSLTQNRTETNIRQILFQQQLDRQLDTNQALARHIGSDLDSILMRLQVLANMEMLQDGDLSSPQVRQIASQYFETANEISYIDFLFIYDKEDVAIVNIVNSPDQQIFEGTDFSERDYVQQARATKGPVFSDGFKGADGKYRIAIVQPIINRETGEYVGLVGTSVPTTDFFGRYGNIYEIKSQYLAALDQKANHLVHGNQDLIGRNFFEQFTQQFTQENPDLNTAMTQVLSGEPAHLVYTIQSGERLTSGHPIVINGEVAYVVFIVTPTALIYSNIDSILSEGHSQTIAQQVTLITAAGLFVIFAVWLNRNLNKEVKSRTNELEFSNRQLSEANEQLRASEKLQQEFINVAAHELRTPIQPLLGVVELIQQDIDGKEKVEITKDDLEMLSRNAKRLERLSSDILEVSRIDSQSMKLKKEPVEMNEKIRNVVIDIRPTLQNNRNLQILFESRVTDPVVVDGDRSRLFEVLSNLIRNAIKFTKEGTIRIILDKQNGEAIVRVVDTGTGIDGEIFPKLFTKFATKSEQGTGLGLYVSKAIVEAHGGKIWAENNPDGRGSTFTFKLPLVASETFRQ